jgi:hypothetical protein
MGTSTERTSRFVKQTASERLAQRAARQAPSLKTAIIRADAEEFISSFEVSRQRQVITVRRGKEYFEFRTPALRAYAEGDKSNRAVARQIRELGFGKRFWGRKLAALILAAATPRVV